MKRIQLGAISLLVLYSLAILSLELRTSQDYVRHYVSDISGPVHFFAVNTTLCAFLLGATALLFTINTFFLNDDNADRKTRFFYLTQILVFLYLSVDERFMLHEWLGGLIGVKDAYLLLLVGLGEGVLLFLLGNLQNSPPAVRRSLLLAAGFFGAMVFIDAFLPDRMLLRLSLEDLCKTWGVFFFFLFALQICYDHVAQLKGRASVNSQAA